MADWFQMQARAAELADAGRDQEALAVALEMSRLFPERSHHNWHPEACLLVRLGRPQAALARLEAAVTAGDVWRARYLADPDYDPIRGDPRFQAVLEHGRARAAAHEPLLFAAAAPAARAPLLLVFHGAGAEGAPELERWRPASGLGYAVAALQSSQPAGPGLFCWDDPVRARADVGWALAQLPPSGRVVTAGFSQGAALALHLALEASLVRPGGVVLVAPSIAGSAQPAAGRRLRISALLGTADPVASRSEARLEELAGRGHHVHVERVEGLSHAYPADFGERLPGLLEAATRRR